MFKAILKFLFELLVAAIIIFLLIKYVPIISEKFGSGITPVSFQEGQQDVLLKHLEEKMLVQADNEEIHASSLTTDKEVEDNPFTGIAGLARQMIISNVWIPTIVTSENSFLGNVRNTCSTPRGNELILDGHYIIAYRDQVATEDNICVGELRKCENGSLLGGYVYPNCTYTIDGVNNGREIIPGATQTKHNLFTFVKGQEIPYEYVQPARYNYPDINKPTYIYDLNGQRITYSAKNNHTIWNNTKNIRIAATIKDVTIPKMPMYASCQTPRGTRIAHGDYSIAYEKTTADVGERCLFEKRPCINGILQGTWTAETCTDIAPKNQEQDTYPEEDPLGTPITVRRGNPIATNIIDLHEKQGTGCTDCIIEEKKCTRRGWPLAGDGICCPGLDIITTSGSRICGKDGKTSCNTDNDCPGESCQSGLCISKNEKEGSCGNGICETNEFTSCPKDCSNETGKACTINTDCISNHLCINGICKTVTSSCGNGTCDYGETATNCRKDCRGLKCGNGYCEIGETEKTCAADCTIVLLKGCSRDTDCPGRHVCRGGYCTNQPSTPFCGDATCNNGESVTTCPIDCKSNVLCQTDSDCANGKLCKAWNCQ